VRVRTKICGIGCAADLSAAVSAGADGVGFIVATTHDSEDELTVPQARELSGATPDFVDRVLVTHATDPRVILHLADEVGVDVMQVHGEVSPETVRSVWRRRLARRVVAVVHVTGAEVVELAIEVAGLADVVLLDSRTATRLGGTGLTHDWEVSRQIARTLDELGRPVILAGGLDGANVAEAIRVVRPFGVDANSRLKDAHGRKDAAACAAFVSTARIRA
jgi:phosphoribosylanthranilate isomerase